jgi:hypothetical protein
VLVCADTSSTAAFEIVEALALILSSRCLLDGIMKPSTRLTNSEQKAMQKMEDGAIPRVERKPSSACLVATAGVTVGAGVTIGLVLLLLVAACCCYNWCCLLLVVLVLVLL